MKNWMRNLREGMNTPDARMTFLFLLEGLLFQFAASIKVFGNNLLATNLGATEGQIGLIQTVGCTVTIVMLLPVGILSDRSRSAKTVPVAMLLLGGLMFILEGLVPWMGSARLVFFFVFMGLAWGLFGAYNGQWQSLFGELVSIEKRNRVYSLRTRVMSVVGILVPIVCGVLVSGQSDSEGKAAVLSVFFCLSGAMMLLQAVAVLRMPGGRRTPEQMAAMDRFSLKNLGEAILGAVKNKPFMGFVGASMLLYVGWHFDWSIWYIGQVKYAMLTEAQLSYFNAVVCVTQIFSIGFLAWCIHKINVHFTACLCAGGLALYPMYMLIVLALPEGARPISFIVLCTTASMLEAGIGMCMVQMLLEVVPVKHRSLTISLHTMLTTLSNCVTPLLGVKMYTSLGANTYAIRVTFIVELVFRALVAVYFVVRYLRIRRGIRKQTA